MLLLELDRGQVVQAHMRAHGVVMIGSPLASKSHLSRNQWSEEVGQVTLI
jgi:hypothetical protein